MENYTEKEEKFLQNIQNGVNLTFLLQGDTSLSQEFFKKSAEIRPLDTLRYMKNFCPEKIDADMARHFADCVVGKKDPMEYTFLEAASNWLHGIDNDQFSRMKVRREMPANVMAEYNAQLFAKTNPSLSSVNYNAGSENTAKTYFSKNTISHKRKSIKNAIKEKKQKIKSPKKQEIQESGKRIFNRSLSQNTEEMDQSLQITQR